MEDFVKKVRGLDFSFISERKPESSEWSYKVSQEDIEFSMSRDKEGNWRILSFVPVFIRDLEQDLSEAIIQFNNKS